MSLEDLGWCSPSEAFAWRGIEAVANRPQKSICQRRRAGRAGEVLSKPVVGVFNSAFLPGRLGIAEPAVRADPRLQMRPGREFGATVEGDGLPGLRGQGSEALDQSLHDRLGLAVFVAQDHDVSADALDQGRDVDLPVLSAEFHQVAFPVPELVSCRDAVGPARQALAVEDTGSVMPSVAAGSPPSTVFGEVPIERLGAAIPGIGEPIDRLVADPDRMVLETHPAGDLFRRPARSQPVFDGGFHLRMNEQLAMHGAPTFVHALSIDRVIAVQFRQLLVIIVIPLQFTVDRRWGATETIRHFGNRHLGVQPLGDLASLFLAQVRVAATHSLSSMQDPVLLQNLHFECESTQLQMSSR
jgi:hypothetical protein